MRQSFRQRLKEYLTFTKKDRDGIIVLMILIVLTIAGHYIVETIDVKPSGNLAYMIKEFEAWEKANKKKSKPLKLFHFNPNSVSEEQLDSLNLPVFIRRNIIRYREVGGAFKYASDIRKIYGMNDSIFEVIKPWLLLPEKEQMNIKKKEVVCSDLNKGTFDPNFASADELIKFGFNEFQASNIEKYRINGGQFHVPEDVKRIYGVDSVFYHAVKKYIQIRKSKKERSPIKILLELNHADSLELVSLKGIGPVFASRIIKYRNLLGGFASSDQLLEVYGFPAETYNQLKEQFVVDTLSLKKIRLNFAEYSDLIRHPYLKRNQVEAILKYREIHGPFSAKQQLLLYDLVDSLSYQRIEPYLTCR